MDMVSSTLAPFNMKSARFRLSLLPSLVYNPRSICLPLLQHHLVLPFRHIHSIHPPTRLHAEPSACTSRRCALDSRNIDIFPRIKLERGFSAVHLEVNFAVRVEGFDELLQGRVPRVDGDGPGVLWVQDENVINIGFAGA